MYTPLTDTHVHLNWAKDAATLAKAANDVNVSAFAVTVTPNDMVGADRKLANAANVHVGVGLHPWWVADGRAGADDVGRAVELAHGSRLVGEVGLDLSERYEHARDTQVDALTRVCTAVVERAQRTGERGALSLHAVRATDLVLDILESTGAATCCDCILHWFSGTSDELVRARQMGCLFSVGRLMLRSRRGRAWAKQIPADRLLLETDEPPEPDYPLTADAWRVQLDETVATLAELRGTTADEIATISEANARRVLAL